MDAQPTPGTSRLETADKMEAIQTFIRRAGYNALSESGKELFSSLTVQQVAALGAVRRLTRTQPEGAMHGALAHEMRLTPSAITRLVDPLVNQGMLLRHQSPHDRRGVLLSLTATGVQSAQMVEDKMLEAADSLANTLTEEERNTFTRIIDKLHSALPEK